MNVRWFAAVCAAALWLCACGSSNGSSTGTGGNGGNSGGGSSGTNGGTCSASNCTGCCFNGQCQPGSTAAACGKNGAACVACASPQICKTDQTCGVDPQSVWKVQPVSATISTTNQGADWDVGGGAPDPYVDVWCPATAATSSATPTVQDSFNPTWTTGGCTATAHDLLTNGFAVDVWDEDISSNDPIAGKGTIQVTESQLLSGSISGITNNSTLLDLTVKLQPQ